MLLFFASSSNKTIISCVKNETKNIWSVFLISWCYKRDFYICNAHVTDWLPFLTWVHMHCVYYRLRLSCVFWDTPSNPTWFPWAEQWARLLFWFGIYWWSFAVTTLHLSNLVAAFSQQIQRTCTFLYFQSSNVILFTFLYCKSSILSSPCGLPFIPVLKRARKKCCAYKICILCIFCTDGKINMKIPWCLVTESFGNVSREVDYH